MTLFMGLLFIVYIALRRKPYVPPPLQLSYADQQRLADEELATWLSEHAEGFIFGEMAAAARRIQDKYPLWRQNVAERPRYAEYL